MDIAIIPGATVAVVRMRVKAKVNNTFTKWKLVYKKASDSTYNLESPEWQYNAYMQYNPEGIYGLGPIFYDLTNLEPETTYNIKLVIVSGDSSLPQETSPKTFTTCALGDFEFKSRTYDNSSYTEEQFNTFLDWFKDCMIAVGYDYKVTSERTKHPFSDGSYFSAPVEANQSQLKNRGAYGSCSYGATMTLGYFNLNEDYDKHSIVHEYRHFLGLAGNGIKYHGDIYDSSFYRSGFYDNPNFPAAQYCAKITEITSFTRGVDSKDMEIYSFYGENAVDTKYIPSPYGYRFLGFMLLKALGLNDITIVY